MYFFPRYIIVLFVFIHTERKDKMSLVAIVAGIVAILETSNLDKRTLDLVKAQLEHLISVVENTSGNTSAIVVDELKKQHEIALNELKWQHENALNELKKQHDVALNELKEQHRVLLNKKTKRLTRAKEELKQERDALHKDLEEVRRVSLLQQERCKRFLTEEEKEKRIKAVENTIWSHSEANYTDDSVSGFSSDTDEHYSDDGLEWWNSVVKKDKGRDAGDLIVTTENGESELFVEIRWNQELRCMLDEKFHNLYCNWRGQCIELIDGIAYWYGRVSKKDGKISIDRSASRAWNVAKGIREMKGTEIERA